MGKVRNLVQFKNEDRFLRLSIYQFPLGDCGGVTDGAKNVYIPCVDGNVEYSTIDDKEFIFIEEHRGQEYWALTPNTQPTNAIGPMSGGNLAYSSDSRCKRTYHIHDRFESQAQYDALSR